MARHRQRIRLASIKNSVKHSSTLIGNIGSGSIPTTFVIYATDIGNRSSTGGVQTIKDSATTGLECNVGDIIKYVNICIETAPRFLDNANNGGWLEWALVFQKEQLELMGLTNLGTQTLGDTATKQFRNNVLLTGCFPIGINQGNSQDLKIKIPPTFQKLKLGGNLILFSYFRSVSSTDVRTDSHRHLTSAIFKCYS